MEILFAFLYIGLSLLIPIGIVVLIVGLIVYFTRNKDKGLSLNINHFIRLYFHVIIFVSLMLVVVGGGLVLRSVFGYAFGYGFSYDLGYSTSITPAAETSTTIYPPIDYKTTNCIAPMTKITVNNKDYCFDQDGPKRDLLNGITLLLSMSFILAAHRVGLYWSERAEVSETIRRGFHLFGLISYGLVSIVMIPVSLYGLFDYVLFTQPDLSAYGRMVPGPLLAATIFIVPVWLVYMFLVLKERKAKVV